MRICSSQLSVCLSDRFFKSGAGVGVGGGAGRGGSCLLSDFLQKSLSKLLTFMQRIFLQQ